MNKRFSIFY